MPAPLSLQIVTIQRLDIPCSTDNDIVFSSRVFPSFHWPRMCVCVRTLRTFDTRTIEFPRLVICFFFPFVRFSIRFVGDFEASVVDFVSNNDNSKLWLAAQDNVVLSEINRNYHETDRLMGGNWYSKLVFPIELQWIISIIEWMLLGKRVDEKGVSCRSEGGYSSKK